MKKLLRDVLADANVVVFRDGRIVGCVVGGKSYRVVGDYVEEVSGVAMGVENRRESFSQ